MDKNAIKKYAVWARRELISRVSQRAAIYGITDKDAGDASSTSVNGHVLSETEKKQRQALIGQIHSKGYEQVMEEVAYTWFNRFSALRFMEVNGYLPSHVRVFTDDENAFKPQILTEAINLEIDGIDMEKVYALKNANDNDELFKYLIIVQCNALSEILPGMFQRIADYTELLFPDNLLREGSAVEQMIALIPQDDWQDQVQIIGWLYQYYNSEKKDDVFAALKNNVKITKENIPAATQLFTPDWIVRYMVENSLGRLWIEGHPNDELKSEWKYYLDEAEQEPQVQTQLAAIRKDYAALTPEQIKCIDPCSGSGHICAYMFDVLMQIYEAYGYTAREAVASIVENNIYGLDIDERAAQLAYFAVMMKARQYDRRFFSRGIQPHVYAIQESNHLDSYAVEYFCDGRPELKKAMTTLRDELHDAKEYGSILNVPQVDFAALYARIDEIREDISIYREATLTQLVPFLQCAEALAMKYDVAVTNPPYMAISNASVKLNEYVKDHYNDSKADMFAVFIERCIAFVRHKGLLAMITQQSWMFLASFESLRKRIIHSNIVNMAHLGARAFEEIGGEVVQTTSFVLRNISCPNYIGTYSRLLEYTGQDLKEEAFLRKECLMEKTQSSFDIVPGSPIAYWVDNSIYSAYSNPLLSTIAFSDGQILTGNNNKYLRLLWEVDATTVSRDSNWVLHAKGGEYRRWYGNIDTVVSWSPSSRNHYRKDKIARFPKDEILFRRGITWTLVSMNPNFGVRELDASLTFNKAAATVLFGDESKIDYVIGFLNSKVAQELLKVINPTMNNNIKDILNMPYIYSTEKAATIENLVRRNIALSKQDWDSFETSWDFVKHPLVRSNVGRISEAYALWETECNRRFDEMKGNEEELNRLFLEIYGMANVFEPEVADDTITVRKANVQREIRSLISYAVGCMFGRYSLDCPGLAYAGGRWDIDKYRSFKADKDNIIPICDDEYFEDDIVGRFVDFIRVVYGNEHLEENLRFIASVIGGKGQPKDVIRNYFINSFYVDHLKTYQKHPVYWLFDSGKKNGFKCLIYMHRYQADTIARIRTDYVHEQQSRYRTAIADFETRANNAGTSERVKLSKQLKTLREQADEIHSYEEKIHHLADKMISINLDDGVKDNYAKFKDVLYKI